MKSVINEVQSRSVVIGESKCFFEVLTGSQRKPDIWSCRVDEAEDTFRKEIILYSLDSRRDSLDTHGEIF